MPVTIRNLTSRPMLVPLNSGETLRLSPRQTSQELAEAEVNDNLKINRLRGRHAIAVEQIEKETVESAKEAAKVQVKTRPRSRKRDASSD